MNVAQLITERNRILEAERTLRDERREVEGQIVDLLGKRGYTRWGDSIIRTAPAGSKTVCDDPVGFSEWMEDAPASVIRQAFNPSYVRKTGLPSGVFDTFFHSEHSPDRTLVFLPPDKAPKYMQGLREGMVVVDGEELSVDEVAL